jgi:hypothetical protein
MSISSSPPTHPASCSVYATPYDPSRIPSPSSPLYTNSVPGHKRSKSTTPPHQLSCPNAFCVSGCSGRTQLTTLQDANPKEFNGDDVYLKHPDAFQIFIQNVKGLTYSLGCEDHKKFQIYFTCCRSAHD